MPEMFSAGCLGTWVLKCAEAKNFNLVVAMKVCDVQIK